ncbi:hypothetical protein EB796_000520 [Bugula neritina]|uniref:Uncharacterized protein n=1 Tax=Bugula neritina TaxID=10212 RepID=A0A7J7KSM9_BUGNE|nr:hypothetical protein EB796_000520 [Bugula neritina]
MLILCLHYPAKYRYRGPQRHTVFFDTSVTIDTSGKCFLVAVSILLVLIIVIDLCLIYCDYVFFLRLFFLLCVLLWSCCHFVTVGSF